jgi:hypothetical protein
VALSKQIAGEAGSVARNELKTHVDEAAEGLKEAEFQLVVYRAKPRSICSRFVPRRSFLPAVRLPIHCRQGDRQEHRDSAGSLRVSGFSGGGWATPPSRECARRTAEPGSTEKPIGSTGRQA